MSMTLYTDGNGWLPTRRGSKTFKDITFVGGKPCIALSRLELEIILPRHLSLQIHRNCTHLLLHWCRDRLITTKLAVVLLLLLLHWYRDRLIMTKLTVVLLLLHWYRLMIVTTTKLTLVLLLLLLHWHWLTILLRLLHRS